MNLVLFQIGILIIVILFVVPTLYNDYENKKKLLKIKRDIYELKKENIFNEIKEDIKLLKENK